MMVNEMRFHVIKKTLMVNFSGKMELKALKLSTINLCIYLIQDL